MSKLDETRWAIGRIAEIKESGIAVDNTILLADIAKSLAIIADILCGEESEE